MLVRESGRVLPSHLTFGRQDVRQPLHDAFRHLAPNRAMHSGFNLPGNSMNKIHSKVWNKSLGATVVASELAKANGKGGRTRRMQSGVAALSLAIGMALSATSALAVDAAHQAQPQTSAPTPLPGIANYFSADGAADGTDNALSLGTDSVAGGALSTALGTESSALGFNSLAQDDYSTAVGGNSVAIGIGSSAIGHSAFTGADYATALGFGAGATNMNAVAVGANAQASGRSSVALGGVAVDASGNPEAYDASGNPQAAAASGDLATAVGPSAVASGSGSVAMGVSSQSKGGSAVAIGNSAIADGNYSMAMGPAALAQGTASVANGYAAVATGITSVAIGNVSKATGPSSVSIGHASSASGAGAIGIGDNSTATGDQSVAVGGYAVAHGGASTAMGFNAITNGNLSVAVGFQAWTGSSDTVAVGAFTTVLGKYSTGVGYNVSANGQYTSAYGNWATIAGYVDASNNQYYYNYGTAIGSNSSVAQYGTALGYAAAAGKNDVALGANATIYNYSAFGTNPTAPQDYMPSNSVAIGYNAQVKTPNGAAAQVTNAMALGYNALANASNAVALGANARATTANTVSVGNDGSTGGTKFTSRITNVAAGTAATDAVNVSQLQASGLIDGSGNALMAVTYADATRSAVVLGNGSTPVKLSNVAAGTQATDAVNLGQLTSAVSAGMSQVSAMAVNYDTAALDSVTLGGANGTSIHNVAAGVVGNDAVNMNQLNALGTLEIQDAQAISVLNGMMTTMQGSITSLQQIVAGTAMPPTIAVDGHGSASVQANSGGVAIGDNAKAGGAMGTAVGGDSYAAGPNDTAIGGNAKVNADGSTAVGANTTIAAAATNAVAVGESASVTAASGTAIGQGSSVTASDAVALGQGSVADQANTVSVGSATEQRRITHVAAGVSDTDAVNVGQMAQSIATSAQQTLHSAESYTDNAIGTLRQQMSDQFTGVNRRINDMGAMSAASTQMAINAAGASEKGRVAAGVGYQDGRSAISVGYGKQLGDRMRFSVGATSSGSQTSVGAGFGMDL